MRNFPLVVTVLLVGCVAEEGLEESIGSEALELTSENSLSSNALTKNALTKNALTKNAFTANALTKNALTTNALTKNALVSTAVVPGVNVSEGALARTFLKYVYSCAMPAGVSMTLTIDGVNYGLYQGALGLAPQWGSGTCDVTCQRWVSACVIARLNDQGVSNPISVRGPNAALVVGLNEGGTYRRREGTFFGNVFSEPMEMYACDDGEQFENGGVYYLPTDVMGRICAQGGCGITYLGYCLWSGGRSSAPAAAGNACSSSSNDSSHYIYGCKTGSGVAWTESITVFTKVKTSGFGMM